MKGPTLNAHFFTGNRQRLIEKLTPGALAIIHTNDTLPTNADGTFRFKPNSDLYYLTGITQEETLLVLFPDHSYAEHREILFISAPNELYAKWNGRQLSVSEASVISGIKQVLYVHQFEEWLQRHILRCEHIYLNSNEHPRAHIEHMDRDARFAQWCREKYPVQSYKRLAPVLASLRMIKSREEIAVMRHACAITERGFRRLLRYVKPGVKEKQVQAEMIHEYLHMDADWADYKPIVASGADSCILHYISNHKVCADGDILLIDAAASWLNYNADMTRCLPVNGRFTPRQKAVYQAVLEVHQAMRDELRPGVYMHNLQDTCNDHLAEALIKLGLCKRSEVIRDGARPYLERYCYHNFSHFLGLDVHDVGFDHAALKAGMVMTNEPGIYIAEENLGIRLENNIVITAKGRDDLLAGCPIEPEEIEDLMNATL